MGYGLKKKPPEDGGGEYSRVCEVVREVMELSFIFTWPAIGRNTDRAVCHLALGKSPMRWTVTNYMPVFFYRSRAQGQQTPEELLWDMT